MSLAGKFNTSHGRESRMGGGTTMEEREGVDRVLAIKTPVGGNGGGIGATTTGAPDCFGRESRQPVINAAPTPKMVTMRLRYGLSMFFEC